MTKELFAVLSAVFVALLALLAVLGLRARRRRQRDIREPRGWVDAVPSLVVEALYVATTRAGDPYDRIFAHGLGFRGRTKLMIDAEGVQLLADRRELRITASSIRDVDTYLRVIGDDAAAFAALSALAGTSTTTATTTATTTDGEGTSS